MLTVGEAARRTGRDPETIRRWIRAGRLRAEKRGRGLTIEEADLEAAIEEPRSAPLPERWQKLASGGPMPDPVKAIHEARQAR